MSGIWSVVHCSLGFQKNRQLSVVPSKSLSRPLLHPQSFAEGKDPGVTLLPHSHKHAAYRLFQVIRRIKTHPNPELLCSKSIYNFLSPLPGGESGFQAGRYGVRGCPQCSGQSPRLHQLRELVYFLEAGAFHLLVGKPEMLSLSGPRRWNYWGRCGWRKAPPERKPGILKCCDPGLGTRDEGHGDIELIEKPGGHWPVSQKGR